MPPDTAVFAQPGAYPGHRVIQPHEMTAITVSRDTVVIAIDQQGKLTNVRVPKDTIGYMVMPDPQRPTHILAQLKTKSGKLASVLVPKLDITEGAKHGYQVQTPKVRFNRVVVSISTARSQDLAAKAIIQMWYSIRDNLGSLKELGLPRSDVIEQIISNEAALRRMLAELVAAFTPEAWNTIKDGSGCNIRSLLKLPHVTSNYPDPKPGEQFIYLRLYPTKPNPTRNSNDFAKYGGRSVDPSQRNWQHDRDLLDPTNTLRHYILARGYTTQHQKMVIMMKIDGASDTTVAMAETTICCLFRTWNPALISAGHNIQSTETDPSALHQGVRTKHLREICDRALEGVGFPLLLRKGCNWQVPIEGTMTYQPRTWFHYQVDAGDRKMSVYRLRSRISKMHGKPTAWLHFQVNSKHCTSNAQLPYLGTPPRFGAPMVFSIEVMEDGKPHDAPWYTGPDHGAWNNTHELRSFGIRCEWLDEESQTWFSLPMHCHSPAGRVSPTTSDNSITKAWLFATTTLQFVHNRCYTDPPPYLASTVKQDVKHVVWVHNEQTVKFITRGPPVNHDLPKRASFEDNWKAIRTRWPSLGMRIGPRPPGHTKACLICSGLDTYTATKKCVEMNPNEIDPSEIAGLGVDAQKIADSTCKVCWKTFRCPCVWVNASEYRRVGQTYLPPDYPGLGVIRGKKQPQPVPPPLSGPEYEQWKDEIGAEDDDEVEDGPQVIVA